MHLISQITQHPVYVPRNLTIPPRTVASIVATTKLPHFNAKVIYQFQQRDNWAAATGDSLTYPLYYNTMVEGKQCCVQVVVNLGEENQKIDKGTTLEYFEKWAKEATPDSVLGEQVTIDACLDEKECPEEEPFQRAEMGFLKSPANVDPQEPIKLKDAKVPEGARRLFDSLCEEFEDIFSKHSANLGKTPLLKMDIPTGDNSPVSQKPYTPSTETCAVGAGGDRRLWRKAGVIVWSVSPWASPIVIVPKKTAPGEPPWRRMCIDYRVLNSLLPWVDKAHSKAKRNLNTCPHTQD